MNQQTLIVTESSEHARTISRGDVVETGHRSTENAGLKVESGVSIISLNFLHRDAPQVVRFRRCTSPATSIPAPTKTNDAGSGTVEVGAPGMNAATCCCVSALFQVAI